MEKEKLLIETTGSPDRLKKHKRILFIDDNEVDLKILQWHLDDYPVNIFWAPNIPKAKSICKNLNFDLVVCDSYGVGEGHDFIMDKPHLLTSGIVNPTATKKYRFCLKDELSETVLYILGFKEDEI